MFSCDLFDIPCSAELKYDRILDVEGRGFTATASQSSENLNTRIFSLAGGQVWLKSSRDAHKT